MSKYIRYAAAIIVVLAILVTADYFIVKQNPDVLDYSLDQLGERLIDMVPEGKEAVALQPERTPRGGIEMPVDDLRDPGVQPLTRFLLLLSSGGGSQVCIRGHGWFPAPPSLASIANSSILVAI